MLAIEIQLADVVADHPQSRVVVIDSDPEPPESVKLDGAVATWNWHFCELGADVAVEVCVEVHAAEIVIASTAVSVADKNLQRIRCTGTSSMHPACQSNRGVSARGARLCP